MKAPASSSASYVDGQLRPRPFAPFFQTTNNKQMTKTTYSELLEYLTIPLSIPSLGGKKSLTFSRSNFGIKVENSKGSIYEISPNDWVFAKKIRATYSRNPWLGEHYSGLREPFSYSLIYAAALLRHIEEVEVDEAMAEFMNGFCGDSPDQLAA